MNSIPLEKNLNWWWYKAKSNLLKYIILKSNIKTGSKILEIGPGMGNNLYLLNNYGVVDILETEPEFISYLNKTHGQFINNIFKNLHEILNEYDLIIMLDVLEHIEHSEEFMNNLYKVLKKEGIIILGVPAYQALWSIHDERLLHHRRYSWKKLYDDCKLYRVSERYGLNYLLLPIRYLQIKLNKTTTRNESGKFINYFLYLISLFEVFFRKIKINPKFGISIYAKLEKENEV